MRFVAALVGVAMSVMSACADEAPVSSSLITVDMPAPAEARDTRGDGVLRDGTGRPVSHVLLGERLPAFEAPMVGGDTFSSSALEGRWTVLVAWGVWCHDSRNDLDNIAELARRLSDIDGVDFLSVHVPQNANTLDRMYRDHGSVAGFFEARGVSFPVVLDETSDLRNTLKIVWTPSYLVIGPDLTVHGFRTDLSKSDEGAIDRFLTRIDTLRRNAEG